MSHTKAPSVNQVALLEDQRNELQATLKKRNATIKKRNAEISDLREELKRRKAVERIQVANMRGLRDLASNLGEKNHKSPKSVISHFFFSQSLKSTCTAGPLPTTPSSWTTTTCSVSSGQSRFSPNN